MTENVIITLRMIAMEVTSCVQFAGSLHAPEKGDSNGIAWEEFV